MTLTKRLCQKTVGTKEKGWKLSLCPCLHFYTCSCLQVHEMLGAVVEEPILSTALASANAQPFHRKHPHLIMAVKSAHKRGDGETPRDV